MTCRVSYASFLCRRPYLKRPKITSDSVFYLRLPQEGILLPKYMQAGFTTDFYRENHVYDYLTRVFSLFSSVSLTTDSNMIFFFLYLTYSDCEFYRVLINGLDDNGRLGVLFK